MAGALIVLAEFGASDFGWLEQLRRRHYPPERNHVPAHLTMFRTLPPSAEAEIRGSLERAARDEAPQVRSSGIIDLDGGVAVRMESPELERIRAELAGEFHGLMTSQDIGRWVPHVTIQNKVKPSVAKALVRTLRSEFEPRPVKITGLALVRYARPEWQPITSYRFSGFR